MASILTTGAAAGAAFVLAAVPAAAAGSFTVTNLNADGHFAAATDLVLLTDNTSGVGFECDASGSTPASNSTGSIPTGTSADVVGKLSVDFNNCTGPLGAGTAVANNQPYSLHITGYDAAGGKSTGYVGPVSVHASTLGCEFDVTGNAPATYDNATGTLSFTPDAALPAGVTPLKPANIDGCFGLVSPTDELVYEADYHLSDPSTPITITG
ncbi:MAG TPA: hypothetical protein VJT49_12575 [Amycolatopsis sp.]|uniref:hypothetical protein n=1 Tax=Amycolatopsis sp. TaxID=37632 RepID=UPI002B47F139|nr:hypothetical protein [Amycolatopsis sp.]HKS45923.1 hypothetical protein [Amycolatopsis sp.]